MMKQFKVYMLIIIGLCLSSCGSIKEGFTYSKKNNSDEFLVEKRSPLTMPPDFNKLPIPNEDVEDEYEDTNQIESLISKNKNNEIEDSTNAENKSFEDSLLKKIKDN